MKFLEARIKDQNTQVTFIALDVMDQCMEVWIHSPSVTFARFSSDHDGRAELRIHVSSAGAKESFGENRKDRCRLQRNPRNGKHSLILCRVHIAAEATDTECFGP